MPDIFISEEKKQKPEQEAGGLRSQEPESEIQIERLQGHTHNPLASYCYYPDNVTFENREKQEKVVLLLRKHPISNLPWVMGAILLIFAPIALSIFPILSFLPARFQLIAVLGWYLAVSAFILEKFLTWFYDIFIITDERIVDVDFYDLLYKEVSDASLSKIQDVTYTMGGAVRAMFNYGDVVIQTAAEVEKMECLAVPKPDQVEKILQDLRMQGKKEDV